MVSLPRRDQSEFLLRFDDFNSMMTFIGVSRSLSHCPLCEPTPPTSTSTSIPPNPDLYRDIYSLLYLYYPDRLQEANSTYMRCISHPSELAKWTDLNFNLPKHFCRNIHVCHKVAEVEQLITQDSELYASEVYLRPQYLGSREIPPAVSEVVAQLQQRMQPEVFVRLVQACQFSYPSPQPLVRAILDLYEEQWVKVFDEAPHAFLRVIRESSMYCSQSFTNRSYRNPHTAL